MIYLTRFQFFSYVHTIVHKLLNPDWRIANQAKTNTFGNPFAFQSFHLVFLSVFL